MSILRNTLAAVFTVLFFSLSAVPVPIPAEKRTAANEKTAFDLGAQPPGKFTAGKINFELASAENSGKCGAVILLPGQKEKIRLDLPTPANGGTLYLLHAGHKCGKSRNFVGKATVFFKDGKSQTYPVRRGKEAFDFTASRGGKNAIRAFSIYNGATQISLFVSKFPCKGEVTAVELEAGDVPWMVAAVSIDKDAKIPVIYPKTRAVRKHKPVQPVPAGVMQKIAASEKQKVKNIIFIIGDGMGAGAREFTSRLVYGKPMALPADQFPFQTRATTFSANSKTTDSAASGTALAGGYKTNNGMLGMNPQQQKIFSIASMAKKAGYAVGIVTTDSITGATPSAFFAHVPKRSMAAEIVSDLAECDFDIVAGNANEAPFLPKYRKDKKDMLSILAQQNMVAVRSLGVMSKVPAGKRILGFIRWKEPEEVGKALEITLNRLKNDKGMFVMIECSWPDGGGHGNNPDISAKGVLGAESAAVAALKFAADNPGTLIVVTADHETGGITVVEPENDDPVMVKYSTVSHTGNPVPFFAAGSGSQDFPKKLDNTDIPKTFARQLGVQILQPVK